MMMNEAVVQVSVALLAEIANPLACWNELEKPITPEEVFACLKCSEEALCDTPIWYKVKEHGDQASLRQRHIRKIAFFVKHGSDHPISIDVGVPSLGCYVEHIIEDGNHRLAGAILKGTPYIPAEISGCMVYAEELGLMESP